MARPAQARKVCQLPQCTRFLPESIASSVEVQLTVDEYEALRLMDLEGFTQAECAQSMGTARTTVQSIYASARRKVARMLVERRPLVITGGVYRLCPGLEPTCLCGGCEKHRCCRCDSDLPERKANIMRIAVTYEKGEIFQHFGHTEQFKFFDVEGSKIIETRIVPTEGSGHGALAGFLTANQANAVICGGIGPGAQNALQEAGITLYAGVRGSADAAVLALLAGKLDAQRGATCDHHEAGHTCGAHGCGEHSCHGA